VNPIRLVSGAIALPAHAAAAVLGASVGVATAGARTTARVVSRVVERASGTESVPYGSWPGARPAPSEAEPTFGTRPAPAETPAAPAPAATAAPAATKAPARKAPEKKAPATRATAKKAPARKAPARKKPAKKAPSAQAAVLAPALGLTEAEAEAAADAVIDDGPTTPSGIPAAGEGFNPDTTETDLHQPGTEPLMDPATVKAVASESEMLRRAADTDKG
jgi:hypothetical protein